MNGGLQLEIVVQPVQVRAKGGERLRERGACAALVYRVVTSSQNDQFRILGCGIWDLQKVGGRAGVYLRDSDSSTKDPWGSIVVVVKAGVDEDLSLNTRTRSSSGSGSGP